MIGPLALRDQLQLRHRILIRRQEQIASIVTRRIEYITARQGR